MIATNEGLLKGTDAQLRPISKSSVISVYVAALIGLIGCIVSSYE